MSLKTPHDILVEAEEERDRLARLLEESEQRANSLRVRIVDGAHLNLLLDAQNEMLTSALWDMWDLECESDDLDGNSCGPVVALERSPTNPNTWVGWCAPCLAMRRDVVEDRLIRRPEGK